VVNYQPNGSVYQLVDVFNGFPTVAGPVEFVPAVLNADNTPPTAGAYFQINAGGAGVYLVHYGLVGIPNGALRTDLQGDNVNAWILLRVTNGATTNYYGAAPLINANSHPNDPDLAHQQSSLVTAFGQYQLPLVEGDQVSLMLYLHVLNGQEPGADILVLDPDNIIDFTNPPITTLSPGGSLSLIRIGDIPPQL
jgi:hypothetical protein